jgi:prepilin peptidase CpaA
MDAGRLALDGMLLAVAGAAAVTDVRSGRVPNVLTYGAALAALVLHAFLRPAGIGLPAALAGLAVGFFPLFLAYLAGGIGGGDVKLMGAMGAFLGPYHAAVALLYSCLVGAVLSVAMILFREGFTGIAMRFASLWRVREADAAWASRLRLPFAVAVLVGVAWTITERNLGASALDLLKEAGR